MRKPKFKVRLKIVPSKNRHTPTTVLSVYRVATCLWRCTRPPVVAARPSGNCILPKNSQMLAARRPPPAPCRRRLAAHALFDFAGKAAAPPSAAPSTPASSSTTARAPLALVMSSCVIPHPEKASKGGEDAHALVHAATGGCLALADGVSGWTGAGVEPSAYSRLLCRCVADGFDVASSTPSAENASMLAASPPPDPGVLLTAAHASSRVGGSATALVAVLDGSSGVLRGANVGDSGLRVFRSGGVIFATSPQQHAFDCPFQLSCPSFVPGTDLPSAAERFEVVLRPGDLVIAASDGLFDNLSQEAVASIASDALGSDGGVSVADARRVATALARAAFAVSVDRSASSPYSIEAAKHVAELRSAGAGATLNALMGVGGKIPTIGGKIDDITVVAAVVVETSDGGGVAAVDEAEEAADEARRSVPSAVGSARAEGRALLLGASIADEAARLEARMAARGAARRAEAAAASNFGRESEGLGAAPPGDAALAAMGAAEMRKELAARGLPTSGA